MVYFSTKKQIRTFEYHIHWNINIRKKNSLINGSVGWNKHSGSSINQRPNSIMSVMPCTGAAVVKKNSYLAARIVSSDTVGLDILTFRFLEKHPSKDILLLMALL